MNTHQMKQKTINYLGVLNFLLFSASTLSLFAFTHWTLELLSHFKHLYLFFGISFLAVFIIIKQYKHIVLAIFTILTNVIFVLPFYSFENTPPKLTGKQTFSVMLSNVERRNAEHLQLINYINQKKPDVLVLQEVNKRWLSDLNTTINRYHHRLVIPRDDGFGIALLSKFPFATQQIANWGPLDVPSIEVQLTIDEHHFYLLTSHPIPPLGATYSKYRNQQLKELAMRASEIDQAKLVVGDLNITPWSPHYKQLEQNTGLSNSRNGLGLLNTWPAQLPLLGIPIDHILMSNHFSLVNLETGPNIGSDHLPLYGEFTFK